MIWSGAFERRRRSRRGWPSGWAVNSLTGLLFLAIFLLMAFSRRRHRPEVVRVLIVIPWFPASPAASGSVLAPATDPLRRARTRMAALPST